MNHQIEESLKNRIVEYIKEEWLNPTRATTSSQIFLKMNFYFKDISICVIVSDAWFQNHSNFQKISNSEWLKHIGNILNLFKEE